VIGLSCEKASRFDSEQFELLEAFCRHIALALDRQRLGVESEKAKLLAESERLSKALLNSVSHEIRTPLAAIKSAAGTLLEIKEPVLSDEQEEMVAEIQEATERLNGLVGKVLDITRLESGNLKPRLDLCDVNDLVQIAIKETRRELAQHKVTVELAPDLPLVRGDFVLLEQALANLLCNAAVHTPPGTPIQIGARVRDRALVLTVADRGPGIPPESIPRVFDKFYRAPGAPTGGTGLGLSLVKGFVDAHQGEVKAENRTGGGALFTIRLPMIQTAPNCLEASL
jgi:two-component system sensor histidine kinase KdpD